MERAPLFSIIISCFQEEHSLRDFHARLSPVVRGLRHACEIIYVNDGSTDGTLPILEDIFAEDPLVTRVIDLARNAGQNNAQTAGIQHARGKHFIFMDCDLQVNPQDVNLLLDKFFEGYDMVGGNRIERHDNALRVFVSRLGNTIISRILGTRVRDLGCGLKVINGDLIRAFEMGPFRPLDPGAVILSLRQMTEVPISHRPRKHGQSRWTFRRVIILYHNIFSNLIPVIYPFVVLVLLLLLSASMGYLLWVWSSPVQSRVIQSPVLLPFLVTLHMCLNLGFFLLLAEFILQARTAGKVPAYIVRQVWARPAGEALAAHDLQTALTK